MNALHERATVLLPMMRQGQHQSVIQTLLHQNKSSGFKQGKSSQIGMNDNLRLIQHKMRFGELNKDLVKNTTFASVYCRTMVRSP